MIALLAAAGGGAYAATTAGGNRSGVIVACVHRNGGGLYVAKRCAKRDSRLTWDVRGLRGLTGLPGPKGDTGSAGPSTGPAGGDLSGSYPNPTIADGAVTSEKVAAANKDGAANVPSLRTLGTGALQAMPGNAAPGGPPTGTAGGALTGTYPNPLLATPETPHAISFQNGWHDYYLAYNAARYYKDPVGTVHLMGAMAGGTLTATAFTLPAGDRPYGVALFPVLSTTAAGGGGTIVPGSLLIFSDGRAHIDNGGNNAFVSLEGITFRAAN